MARTNITKRELRFPLDNRRVDVLKAKLDDFDAALDAQEAAGVSAQAIHDHATAAVVEILPAVAGIDRAILVVGLVTETLAATTLLPIFDVGYPTDDNAVIVGYNAGTAGDVITGVGILPAGEALNVTITDGTGGSEAGKLQIAAIVIG